MGNNIISYFEKEITPEKAYFLGGLVAASEEYNQNGMKAWVLPMKHNFKTATDNQILHHKYLIEKISDNLKFTKVLGRKELVEKGWFQSNKNGFALVAYCEASNNFVDIYSFVKKSIKEFDVVQRRSFLLGAFDGRSSLDRNLRTNILRYIVLDCPNYEVASLLRQCLEIEKLEYNFNTNRDRVEGGEPRKPQLRIKATSTSEYVENIGFISPYRFDLALKIFCSELFPLNDDILPGLKRLSREKPEEEFKENPFEISDAEQQDDDWYNIQIDNYVLNQDEETVYSGYPKDKPAGRVEKGRLACPRDAKVAKRALAIAKYKCEYDEQHRTFLRRRDSLPYTEPHHLIPTAFWNEFNFSLDIEENIVSLCSNCHNKIHYGKDGDEILIKLYEMRKKKLEKVGLSVSLEQLLAMYKF